MDLTEQVKEVLSKDKGFIASNNYSVLKLEENYCEMEGAITESSFNAYGIVHGGYLFGLADTAGGLAARARGSNAVTINANIDYLKVCRDNKVKAVAKCLKNGKTIAVYEVFLYDLSDNLIAKASFSYFYVN